MRKVVTAISALALIASLSNIALADVGSTTKATSSIKNKIAQQKEMINAKIASSTEKTVKKLDKERAKILQNYVEAIRNLKSLATRVQSRINKVEAMGINASSTQALLDIANAKITIAENDLTGLQNVLASSTATSTRKTILASVKVEAAKAKEDIKAAHKALVDTINSLKPGDQKQGESTSTDKTHATSTEGKGNRSNENGSSTATSTN